MKRSCAKPVHRLVFAWTGGARSDSHRAPEGARWCDQAFQAAGWAKGTFKADILPAGADPMDVRYNMIQWVHRYTRGWSYWRRRAWSCPAPGGHQGERNPRLTPQPPGLPSSERVLLPSHTLTASRFHRPATPCYAEVGLQRPARARRTRLAARSGLAHDFAASRPSHAPTESVSVMDYSPPPLHNPRQKWHPRIFFPNCVTSVSRTRRRRLRSSS